MLVIGHAGYPTCTLCSGAVAEKEAGMDIYPLKMTASADRNFKVT